MGVKLEHIPVIDMKATGENILRLRINARLKVKDVQKVFGFTSPQVIYDWQHGTKIPKIDNLVVLARLFGVTVEEIIAIKEDKN